MAVFKKKTMRLNEMLETGLVAEGELLRYKVRICKTCSDREVTFQSIRTSCKVCVKA